MQVRQSDCMETGSAGYEMQGRAGSDCQRTLLSEAHRLLTTSAAYLLHVTRPDHSTLLTGLRAAITDVLNHLGVWP
jgi:hypothetical protein